ncbi:glycerophosphodiester phosphodiesterase [Psychrobacter sp. I-STPA6b]|uniref:glycerophosphodiester phosphodiesterase n=1 Tax=Psychrobacter sp. I-STPA6b TaxID=2585718 RepID=UPI001D0CD2CF|nr:glycerophosphodiester phosphodiesterase [Psychrobacter sp. I-STPA6b]
MTFSHSNPKYEYDSTQHLHSKLLGHRGARGEYLENSAIGFEYLQSLSNHSPQQTIPTQPPLAKPSFALPLIGVEFDVQLTADGILVVYHDDNLERLYQHQARLDDLRYQQLMRLTQPTLPILRLDEMLPFLTGYQRIELEVKTHIRSHIPALVTALQHTLSTSDVASKFMTLPITLTSFDTSLHASLQRCKKLAHYPRGLLVEKDNNFHNHSISTIMDEKLEMAQRLGCQHLGLQHSLIDKSFVQKCHKRNLTLSAWTVNDEEQVKKLATLGVHYIITDYPSLFSTKMIPE